jgi:amino acid adenylation domain-containing protein
MTTGLEIAVIGMSGRFPGARNIDEFWDNLKDGVESLYFFSDDELRKSGVDENMIHHPGLVRTSGGKLEDKEYFDASFFDYSDPEARVMNPQTRIFHECAWTALENAGYDPFSFEGLIGLYAGAVSDSDWKKKLVVRWGNDDPQLNDMVLTESNLMTLHVSYRLNLTGPSYTLQTTCSSSLVAVDTACRALLTGQCHMALAGGVALYFREQKGYIYREEMIYSEDGHCRAFDAHASGTVDSEGVGVVVLKLLEEAIADRDNIYAVVKGAACNNDGYRRVSFTAPGVKGQIEVIKTAMQMAEVEPESITYVETHGTGTNLGDPIEIEALKEAFNTTRRGYCALGAVKTNIGHLAAAAGVAGFIKTVLVLKNRLIPPNLHFQSSNRTIDFENSPFYVNTKLKKCINGKYPLRAGISSFGFGGTNAHVVLEEWPKAQGEWRREQGAQSQGRAGVSPPHQSPQCQLMLLSAKTPTALDKMTENLAEYFKKNLLNRGNHKNPTNPGLTLANAAYTLQVGRRVFPFRRTVVGSHAAEIIEALETWQENGERRTFGPVTNGKPIIVFMFPGQGAQYVNMGRGLYQSQPVFRREMDRCFEILKSLMGYDIKEILYPHPDGGGGSPCPPKDCARSRGQGDHRESPLQSDQINQTRIAQPLLFAFEYALTRLLMEWGIEPGGIIGHSIGEYTAACLAGVFSLEDALKLVVLRGALMQQISRGAMLSVPLGEEEVIPLLGHDVSLAAVNAPSRCVVSGPHEAIESLEKQLKQKGCNCRRLHTSHAFHSSMMDPLIKEFEEQAREVRLNPPGIPYISNVTGNWITGEEVMSPGYWSRHLRKTVRFADGIKQLWAREASIFIEVGPGNVLSTFVRQQSLPEKEHEPLVINLIRHPNKEISDLYYLLDGIGQLWLWGIEPDWNEFHGREPRFRVSLPAYPLSGQLYRLDAAPAEADKEPGKDAVSDWFSVPVWTRLNVLAPTGEEPGKSTTWLVFCDDVGVGKKLVERLKDRGHTIIKVLVGPGFKKAGAGDFDYTINPRESENYRMLLAELKNRNLNPQRILHLWGIRSHSQHPSGPGKLEEALDLGFFSLFYLAKAIGKQDISGSIDISVVTNEMQDVLGDECLCPGKAGIIGLVKVIPQEYPGIICRSIDLVLPEPGSREENKAPDQLQAELLAGTRETVIAFRRNQRWVQRFEPVRLEESRGNKLLLKKRGVYLITGGTGNIGLVLAEYLAKEFRARLILTGLSTFPARDEWGKWLITHEKGNKISLKIKKLRELEEMGAEVVVFSADVGSLQRMQEVFHQAEEKFGNINGVIHGAGIIGGKTFELINKLEDSDCREQFQAKVYGLLVLDTLLKDKELDFCWLLSSISTVLGGLGFAAYASANSFMDAWVYKHNRLSKNWWMSLGWDQMEPAEIVTCFKRLFSIGKVPQVIVSAGGRFQDRLKKWINLETLQAEKAPGGKKEGISLFSQRPNLKTPYLEPRSPLERELANHWQKLLGLEKIGIRDDFFDLGGDSLKAMTLVGQIHKIYEARISVSDIINYSTVEKIAPIINKSGKESYLSIAPTEAKEYYPLSSAQKRFYVLQQMTPDTTVYNLSQVMRLEGRLEKKRMETAVRKLLTKHQTLRTSFFMTAREVFQREKREDEIDFSITFVNAETEKEAGTAAAGMIYPFDLEKAPLLRVGLVKTGSTRYILVADMHHIISDGISLKILTRDFMALYTGEELPSLNIRYVDYSMWQNYVKGKEIAVRQKRYWKNVFQGETPVFELPVDKVRPAVQSYEGSRVEFSITPEETGMLSRLGLEEGATLYMVLLAVYHIFLSKLSGQEDIVIGSPVAGRDHADLEPVIGVFINTLPLRIRSFKHQTIKAFLVRVKENTLMAFENREYQYEDLVEEVVVTRDISRNPLFDVMFIWQNIELPPLEIPGLKLTPYQYETRTSMFDLTLEALEREGQLFFSFQYCTKLFKPETIERFVRYFNTLVSSVINRPGDKIEEIEILPPQERERILKDFNCTDTDYPRDKTIQQLFAAQVRRTPEYPAVVCEGKRLSYIRLNQRANRLARLLRKQGMQPGKAAVIAVERSLELVIAVLAVLKTGGAYLPVDASYPKKRIEYILKDSCSDILLTNIEGMYSNWPGIGLIDLNNPGGYEEADSDFPSSCKSTDAAYIVYTSGTTGKPKGVVVPHRCVVNFITGLGRSIVFTDRDAILSLTTVSFDIFGLETLLPLSRGAKVVIGSREEQLNSEAAARVFEKENITIFQVTPSRLQLFISNSDSNAMIFPCLKSLKYLLVGGEAFPSNLHETVKNLIQGKIYNLYGPAETTIWSTVKDVTGENALNIGKPIANTQIYILSAGGAIQPIGVTGELCIGGDGVARGYVNRPELTAEKFDRDLWDYQDYHDEEKKVNEKVPGKNCENYVQSCNHAAMQLSPHYPITPLPHCPIYRTGDLARWLSDGNIEFSGRVDHQIKIRGFRIEPEEIESLLKKHPMIKEAVVVAKDLESDRHLCAYVVSPRGDKVDNAVSLTLGLRDYLSGLLPDYMVPSYYVEIDEIPLTPNGKIDRKALPEPGIFERKNEYIAPGNEVEEKVANLCAEVLRIDKDKISIHDNFFHLGATSLNIININSGLKRVFDKDIPVVDMFKYLTIHALARFLSEECKPVFEETLVKEIQRSGELRKGKHRLQQKINRRRGVGI